MAIGVEHVNKANAQSQPDCRASTIALTDTLEGKDIQATTVESGAVPIRCAEEELHQAEGLEHGRKTIWRGAQALAGNGAR